MGPTPNKERYQREPSAWDCSFEEYFNAILGLLYGIQWMSVECLALSKLSETLLSLRRIRGIALQSLLQLHVCFQYH